MANGSVVVVGGTKGSAASSLSPMPTKDVT